MSNIPYEIHTLANGLRVIIHEDHSVPKAVMNILYRVGSKDEEAHRTGFAHLFEHLMFEGSRHIPHYDEPLQRAGGQNNAFTTSDITNYYLTLPSNQLETAFWLESDRMLELAFSEEKLAIQKSVVIEEFKQRYLNQPYGDAHLRLRGLHFQQHPYNWATIGKEISHIEGATLEYVQDFFFGYYAPNNATMVVAGDVDPAEVMQLAEKWFGPIPERALKKHPLPQEPAQTAPRRDTVYADVPFPAVYKMYHMPAHTDRDYYVADLITDLLSSGRNARLFLNMVKQRQVATSVSAFSWGMYDPGALSIDAQIAAGHSPEAYEEALQQELDSLQDLSEEDLQRIKNKVESMFVLNQMTILNKAMSIATCDSLGDPELINTTPQIYQAITLEELKEVAARIFHPNNCSTLYYLPK
ncbi:MAG: insulinase family protein [Bacteroidetes bacterium]|nr:MAG: insulinase family protein [Bacteroidota bacterium]